MRNPKLAQRALLGGAAVFLIGSFAAFQDGDMLVASANMAMALVNLLAFRFGGTSPDSAQLGLYLANAALAFVMTYAMFAAGKQGLPYAWAVAGVVFAAIGWTKHGRALRGQR